jgi:hypothetical protein
MLTLLIIAVSRHDTTVNTTKDDIGVQATTSFAKEAARVWAGEICSGISAAGTGYHVNSGIH